METGQQTLLHLPERAPWSTGGARPSLPHTPGAALYHTHPPSLQFMQPAVTEPLQGWLIWSHDYPRHQQSLSSICRSVTHCGRLLCGEEARALAFPALHMAHSRTGACHAQKPAHRLHSRLRFISRLRHVLWETVYCELLKLSVLLSHERCCATVRRPPMNLAGMRTSGRPSAS